MTLLRKTRPPLSAEVAKTVSDLHDVRRRLTGWTLTGTEGVALDDLLGRAESQLRTLDAIRQRCEDS